jgi:hypothetical protein
VESEDGRIPFRVHCRPSETVCQTADEVSAVSTKLRMPEVTNSSVDYCASTTKHSEGASEDSKIAPGLYGTSPHGQKSTYSIFNTASLFQ